MVTGNLRNCCFLARRLLALSAAMLAIVWTAQSSYAAPTWKDIGPHPVSGGDTGRVSDIAAHPSDADVFFIATASGGAWRYDHGTWTAMTDKLSMLATGAIAVDPKNPDTLYVGGGEPNFAPHCFYGTGIFKSKDGGKSWKNVGAKVSAGRAVSNIVISAQDSKVLYASVQRAGGSAKADAARHHPGKDSAMGVFRSEDGGKSWTRCKGLPKDVGATDVVISAEDHHVVYAALGDRKSGSAHGVYRSKDGGKNWSKLKLPGVGSDIGRVSLAISPSSPNVLYVVVAAGTPESNPRKAKVLGLWRSEDGGDSFTKHNPGRISAGFGWFMLVAGVHPSEPKQVAVGGLNLVRSTNGGKNFSDISPPHPDVHAIAWDAKGRMLVGDDGGVHRSASQGGRWESLNKGLGSMQFYPALALHPTKPNWILGGLQDNGTILWNGKSWRRVIGGDGGYAALHPKNPEVVLGQSQHTGNLMRSTNGGRSFRSSSSGINKQDRDAFFNPVIFDPHNPDWAYYATQRLYRSQDQGRSWRAISKDLTDGAFDSAIRSIDVSRSEKGVIYVVTTDGRVMVSEDGGKDFRVSLQDLTDWKRVSRDLVISSRSADVAYLGVPRFGSAMGRVLKTEDRGKTWVDISGNLPDVPVASVDHYANPDSDGEGDVLFVGTDNDVYISCSDGERWTSIGKGRANALTTELRYQPQFSRLVAGTMGRGVWLLESAGPDALRALCDAEEPGDENPEDDSENDPSQEDGPDEGSAETDSGDTDAGDKDGSNEEPKDPSDESNEDEKGSPKDPSGDAPQGEGSAKPGQATKKGGCLIARESSGEGGAVLGFGLWGWQVMLRRRRRRCV